MPAQGFLSYRCTPEKHGGKINSSSSFKQQFTPKKSSAVLLKETFRGKICCSKSQCCLFCLRGVYAPVLQLC